ncbi:MAG: CDP-alcohol phosphatidyltransferase family protein [Myxococcota bacterium]
MEQAVEGEGETVAAPAAPPRLRELGLADAITLGNAACGVGAILLAFRYALEGGRFAIWWAFALLLGSLLCDVADGWVARSRRSSPFGGDLDSLSDVISFGVAPVALGYALGLRGGWDAVVLIFFVCCGVARLARYNVIADSMKTDAGKVSHYEGTPIPTSLLVVAYMAVLFGQHKAPEELTGYRFVFLFHPTVLIYALSGALMISRVRIPKP